MIPAPLHNQWAAEWHDLPLGDSGLKMAGFGCYTSSVSSMLAGAYDKAVTPGTLCQALNSINGYDKDGQLKWDALSQLYPDVFLYRSAWTTNFPNRDTAKEAIETALKRIERSVKLGMPVLLCVDNILKDRIPDHAVNLFDAPADRAKWRIMDPDGGKTVYFKDKYGPVETGIYGYRMIVGSPLHWPDDATELEKDAGIAAWKASMCYRGKSVATYSKEILDTLLV